MRRYAIKACLVAVFLFASQQLQAQTLETAINKMAQDIHAYLSSRDLSDVQIGSFEGPPESSAGRLIGVKLKEQLTKLGINVAPLSASKRKLTGKFVFKKLNENQGVIVITADLTDKDGAIENGFRQRVKIQEVKDLADLAKLLGISFDGTSKETEDTDSKKKDLDTGAKQSKATKLKNERRHSVLFGKENPSFYRVSDSIVAPSKTSDFHMELLVQKKNASTYEPIEIGSLQGFAFAPLQEGDLYSVRIYNHASHDIAVKLDIDGINTLSLSNNPAFRSRGAWIIRAGNQGTIIGWHKSHGISHKFLVTSTEDAVASQLGSPLTPLGTITASFYHAWDPSHPTPRIERILGGTMLGIGTGEGPLAATHTKAMVRKIGHQILASVSIRYESPDISDLPTDSPTDSDTSSTASSNSDLP